MTALTVVLLYFFVTIAVVSASIIPKSFEAIKPLSFFGSSSLPSKQWASFDTSSVMAQRAFPRTPYFASTAISTGNSNIDTQSSVFNLNMKAPATPQSPLKAYPLVNHMSRASYGTPGMTVYMKYYYPVENKCPKDYYCRAEMTIYQEFEGTTVFVVGYGVWHFNSPNAYIPDSTLKAIQATTDIETYEYIAALRSALYANYPYQNTLCQLDYGQALAAMKKVYADMSQCSNTVGIVCERAETVAKCNFK